MGIGVEIAELEQLLQPGDHPGADQGRRIQVVRLQFAAALQLGAVDPAGGEHPPTAEGPHHGGHGHLGMVREQAGEAFGVVGLAPVVDLLEQGEAELVDDRPQPEAEVQGQEGSRQHRQRADDDQITAQDQGQPRPLHLHRHPVAVREPGPVDLPQAGGGHRIVGELLEQLVGGGAQLLLDQRQGDRMGERGQIVLKPGQLLQPVAPDQVGPGGEGLAHLDEAGTQVAQGAQDGAGQPLLDPLVGAAPLDRQAQDQTRQSPQDHDQAAQQHPGPQQQPAQIGVGVVAGDGVRGPDAGSVGPRAAGTGIGAGGIAAAVTPLLAPALAGVDGTTGGVTTSASVLSQRWSDSRNLESLSMGPFWRPPPLALHLPAHGRGRALAPGLRQPAAPVPRPLGPAGTARLRRPPGAGGSGGRGPAPLCRPARGRPLLVRRERRLGTAAGGPAGPLSAGFPGAAAPQPAPQPAAWLCAGRPGAAPVRSALRPHHRPLAAAGAASGWSGCWRRPSAEAVHPWRRWRWWIPPTRGWRADLPALVDLAHRRGLPVLVDQAHGGGEALAAGADLVVLSLQKSATGLAQSAALLAQGERVAAVGRSSGPCSGCRPPAPVPCCWPRPRRPWSMPRPPRARTSDARTEARAVRLRRRLEALGWPLVANDDPLRLVLATAPLGINGLEADAWLLRPGGDRRAAGTRRPHLLPGAGSAPGPGEAPAPGAPGAAPRPGRGASAPLRGAAAAAAGRTGAAARLRPGGRRRRACLWSAAAGGSRRSPSVPIRRGFPCWSQGSGSIRPAPAGCRPSGASGPARSLIR